MIGDLKTSQNIFIESWLEGKCLVGKGALAQGGAQPWDDYQAKPIQGVVVVSDEVASRCVNGPTKTVLRHN